jgi:hypothetical protein
MEVYCEHSTESTGSIKYLGNSWEIPQTAASQEGLSAIESAS